MFWKILYSSSIKIVENTCANVPVFWQLLLVLNFSVHLRAFYIVLFQYRENVDPILVSAYNIFIHLYLTPVSQRLIFWFLDRHLLTDYWNISTLLSNDTFLIPSDLKHFVYTSRCHSPKSFVESNLPYMQGLPSCFNIVSDVTPSEECVCAFFLPSQLNGFSASIDIGTPVEEKKCPPGTTRKREMNKGSLSAPQREKKDLHGRR